MSFAQTLLGVVDKEWTYFDKDLGTSDHYVEVKGLDGTSYKVVKEVYGKYNERIADYWRAVPAASYKELLTKFGHGASRLDGTLRNLPWSAAFISWCMKQAGAGRSFPYSTGHATWIVASIKARQAGKAAPLLGYRPGEQPLKVGDLVGWSRGKKKVTYDTAVATGWFESHTDIVVALDKVKKLAYSTGGNVGQSVSRRELAIDGDGRLTGRSVLVHIVNTIEPAAAVAMRVPRLENNG